LANYIKEVNNLKKRLDNIENKLKEISIEISTTKEVSNLYWSKLKSEVSKLYEESRKIYADWSASNIPKAYKDNLRDQISRIKGLTYKPKVTINYKSFVNKDLTKQSISTILNDSLSSFFTGTQQGEKTFNRLMNTTQQINLQEKEVNKAIEKGFIEGADGIYDPTKKVGAGSLYGARRQLQKDLLKKSLNEQYITIIDKNGKPIKYNIKSYAEMVARTKLIETQSSSTVNLSLSYGSGLVQVSSHNTLTPYDATFEGKVFDLTGENPRFPSATDLPPFHPNCKHTLTVFFEEAHSKNEIQKISDFSKGKTEVHPTRKSHVPISERKSA
jgi:hypothetical protein